MAIPGPDVISFGTLLKGFRTRRRLTQEQLAQTISVHRSAVNRWEQGSFLPKQKGIVLELAKHLRLDEQETRQLLEASLTALSPHWAVPLLRNPFFTGREEILEALHAQLGVDQTVALTQSSALHGLGGVGKTQIALEYAYRHAFEYSAVFWIGAETSESIISGLLSVAEVLQLPGRDHRDPQRVIAAVQRWLTTHSQWLFVWDNVEDLNLLNRFLPPTRTGAILITTRYQAPGTLARSIDLLPMELEEGTLFLLRRARVLDTEAMGEQVHQLARKKMPSQYAAAVDLVTVLGGLPLALDQAGAYIEETRCGLSDYLLRYEQQRTRLLERRGGPSSDHPNSVTATFLLAIERVERKQLGATDVLRVCALLHAEGIPEELFLAGAAYLGSELAALAADPFQFDQTIAFLGNLSLVQRQPETRTLSLHRLVQVVLKEHMPEAIRRLWVRRMLRTLSQLFPSDERTQANYWQSCERLLPHALACLTQSEQEVEEAVQSIPLLSHVATYLSDCSRYAEAEALFQRAIRLGEQALGADHPQVGEALCGLATLSWRRGKYAEAEPLFQRAIRLGEQALGVDHPQVGEALYRLASLYRDQGKYAEAEALFQRAIRLGEQALGVDHPQVATAVHGLAMLYAEQGKYAEAEPLHQRALNIRERALGADHPQVAALLHNLAVDYSEQGRYEEAQSLFQRVLQIWEQALGPEHPRVAHPLEGLAEIASEQGRYEEAQSLFQRVLQIWEQALGPEHPRVAEALQGLAHLFLAQGQDEQARPLLLRALQTREQSLGPNHPKTAETLHDLAVLEQRQGKLSEAVSLAKRALLIRSQALGDAHPQTIALQTLYARLIQEQALPPPSPETGPHSLGEKYEQPIRRTMSVAVRGGTEQVAYTRRVRMREVTFTCAICGQTVTQLHYPSGRLKYCSEGCRADGATQREETRVARQREKRRSARSVRLRSQQEEIM
jgi:tetratricopeptide (TPR) repeat protein/DNA-binding XRE family transcriptional regulator